MPKKIGLIYDVPGWCWCYQAYGIAKYAPLADWKVEFFSQEEFGRIRKAGGDGWLDTFDGLLHFSWPESPRFRGPRKFKYATVVAHHGIEHAKKGDWQACAATEMRNSRNAQVVLRRFDNILAVNEKLRDYLHVAGFPNAVYVPAGVDTSIFTPASSPRDERLPLRVGWCGQANAPTKAYHVFEEIRRIVQGIEPVEFVDNTFTAGQALSQHSMVGYFQGLDAFLCTSISEGTPMPLLEAAACGLPIITTNMGDSSNIVTQLGSGFVTGEIVDEASQREVIRLSVTAILSLAADRKLGRLQGMHSRENAEELCWSRVAVKWLEAIVGENHATVL